LTSIQNKINPMRDLRIEKVVINIGVGKSGEALERAGSVLEELFNKKPHKRNAKKSIRDFGVHQGEAIGVLVTLRHKAALESLKNLLYAKENKLPASSFDDAGNCSFGIKEHIEIPGVKYNPEFGIIGMNVSILVTRPGYRVKRRKLLPSKIGHKHLVTKDEAIEFLKNSLKVEVV